MYEADPLGREAPVANPEFFYKDARYLIGQLVSSDGVLLDAPGHRYLEPRQYPLSNGSAFVLRHRHHRGGVDARIDEYFGLHQQPGFDWLMVHVDDLQQENALIENGDFRDIAALHEHNFAVAAGSTIQEELCTAGERMPEFLRLLHEAISLSRVPAGVR